MTSARSWSASASSRVGAAPRAAGRGRRHDRSHPRHQLPERGRRAPAAARRRSAADAAARSRSRRQLRSLAIGLSSAATHVSAVFPTAIPRLGEIVELTVYRIAQEALANAIRHAGARHITLTLATRRDRLHLEVRDDGHGFDASQARLQALGLASMEERAQAMTGRFAVQSRRGEGTTVTLECPLIDRAPASAA